MSRGESTGWAAVPIKKPRTLGMRGRVSISGCQRCTNYTIVKPAGQSYRSVGAADVPPQVVEVDDLGLGLRDHAYAGDLHWLCPRVVEMGWAGGGGATTVPLRVRIYSRRTAMIPCGFVWSGVGNLGKERCLSARP